LGEIFTYFLIARHEKMHLKESKTKKEAPLKSNTKEFMYMSNIENLSPFKTSIEEESQSSASTVSTTLIFTATQTVPP
jgi:hypothetical protein